MLEDGTVAHWIGKKGAEKVILNFHGMFVPLIEREASHSGRERRTEE